MQCLHLPKLRTINYINYDIPLHTVINVIYSFREQLKSDDYRSVKTLLQTVCSQ